MYIFKENDLIFNWISCLIENRLYFGPFPNQLMIDRLSEENFDLIVNLTTEGEEDMYAIKNEKYLSFPIPDNSIPVCTIDYCSFITRFKYEYYIGKKIYVHCRGGHGRSSMVCCSLLCCLFGYDLKESINLVTAAHNDRVMLRNKWRLKKSPLHHCQFLFLVKIHKNIYINHTNQTKYYSWLSLKASSKPVSYNEYNYQNLYDLLYYDNNMTSCEKFRILYNYFMEKITKNSDMLIKFQLTYLKKFVMTDPSNQDFNIFYENVLNSVRDSIFYNINEL